MFILSVLSCSTDETQAGDPEMIGEWILIKTTSSSDGSEQIGSDMPFQETYFLMENGSFTKVRMANGEKLKATGTFELSETGEGLIDERNIKLYIRFHHDSRSILTATCYSDSSVEHLFLDDDGRLVNTYSACDGLGLQYEKLD